MSIGQLLLTLGVTVWVFDAKKLPQFVSNIAKAMAMLQSYYHNIAAKCDALLQHELNKTTLEHNELKAKQVEDQP